jgi:hypothetical protein
MDKDMEEFKEGLYEKHDTFLRRKYYVETHKEVPV